MASDVITVSGMTPSVPPTGTAGARAQPGSELPPDLRPNDPSDPAESAALAQNLSQNLLGESANASGGSAGGSSPSGVAATDTATIKELSEAVKKINDMLEKNKRLLTFQLDEDSGQMVVRIVDAQTEEVVRQIPSEETLKFAKYVDEWVGLVGLTFNQQA